MPAARKGAAGGAFGGGRLPAWTWAAWLLALGLLGGVGLLAMTRWHRRAAHAMAARTVYERGRWTAGQLALQAARADADGGRWDEFSRALRSLQAVEADLAFVEARRGGTTLFLEDAGAWAAADAREGGGLRVVDRSVGRERVGGGGGGDVAVVVFAATVGDGDPAAGKDDGDLTLSLGLRRDAVLREERAAREAVDSMYRLCVAGWCAVVALGVAGVGWAFRRERRLERRRRREEHLAFSGVLANGIVHDFRNPMSSLRLDAQLLAQEAARGEGARLEKIGERARRLKGTLDRMEAVFREFSTLARPDGTAGDAGRVRLDECARECADMLAPRFEEAGTALDLQGLAPAEADGSGAALKRAVLNILDNALRHSGGGGKTVRVRSGRGGGVAWLEVEDEGPGIPRALRERVFDLFYTTRPQGTGLGLFLARTAVEKCGGRLAAAEPRAGRGARLRMEFPAPAGGRTEAET